MCLLPIWARISNWSITSSHQSRNDTFLEILSPYRWWWWWWCVCGTPLPGSWLLLPLSPLLRAAVRCCCCRGPASRTSPASAASVPGRGPPRAPAPSRGGGFAARYSSFKYGVPTLFTPPSSRHTDEDGTVTFILQSSPFIILRFGSENR